MKSIYLEGNEDLINKVMEIGRSNFGEGINAIDLTPCINKQEVIEKLKKIEEESCSLCEDDLQEYIKELEKDVLSEKKVQEKKK